jgi:hypothetical protein
MKNNKKCFTQYGMRVCEYCVSEKHVHHQNGEKAKTMKIKKAK